MQRTSEFHPCPLGPCFPIGTLHTGKGRPSEPVNGAGGEAVLSPVHVHVHVVAKWLVRSLAGQSPFREQDVSPAPRWLRNRVLPQPAAVQEMLRDETLRNSLFKPCTQLCRASSTSAGLSRKLGGLSSIVLQLMEEQSVSSTFHKLVKSLRLPAMVEEDADRTAVSVFLTSIYIGDMGLGAQEQDMLPVSD